MLDIKFIRENLEKVKKDTANKNRSVDFDRLIELDEIRRKSQTEIDTLRARRNEIAEHMQKERNDDLIEEGRGVKEKMVALEDTYTKINDEFGQILLSVPNIVSEEMPIGKDESENVVIRKWGEQRSFDFPIKDHIEIGKELDLIDVEKSADISGARSYYLKNEAVLIQFAIIQLVMDTLKNQEIISKLAKQVGNNSDKVFIPVLPPVMIKPQIMKKMDRLDPIEERYYIPSDDIVLVGSAEHTLGPLHMDEIVDIKNLPIRYIGYSTAFRREAGSYGKDTKGILRVHQFDKLEIESFSSKENGESEQALIVAIQEYLVQQLEIPHQVISICTGDTGKPDYRQFDIECWIPTQNKYRETHTSDYMTDYQARRLNARYKDENGEKYFMHMNDATAFAISRILIAILENNQQFDGSVIIPKALQSYVGKDRITKKL